ncbi:MAG: glutamate--tRNA ligase family protein [Deltaproteobacteria bacterium]|nr:glutamate--tRNA ligase family protein [Deltaproteobacteria bacterium]
MAGRLAPTPSGHLHLGNVLAFGAAWLSARSAGERLLYRLEDLDKGRSRPEVAEAQRQELRWLGIEWDAEGPPQSERLYDLSALPTFRCDCTRAARLVGACACREAHLAGAPRTEGALRFLGEREAVSFEDRARGPLTFLPDEDPVLQRRDGEVAYPAAVVLDDLRDGVTEVVRGADLLEATAVQLQLHAALGATPPTYLHNPVLLGPDGKKLSKSHGSLELRALRAAGWSPEEIWRRLLPLLGIEGCARLGEALAAFEPRAFRPGPFEVTLAGEIVEP